MRKGTALIFYYYFHGDFGSNLVKVTLQHHNRELTLSHREARLTWRPDWDSARDRVVCPLADAIRQRQDIRKGYPGYTSDYDPNWRELYEHQAVPVPRWVDEQWATLVTRDDED